MSRWARRTDKGHAEIVSALRRLGCAVIDLSRLGGDVPDLLVCGGPLKPAKQAWLVEVKRPDRTGGDSGLSKGQRDLLGKWPGSWAVVWGLDDAIAWACGARRPEMPKWAQRQDAEAKGREVGR